MRSASAPISAVEFLLLAHPKKRPRLPSSNARSGSDCGVYAFAGGVPTGVPSLDSRDWPHPSFVNSPAHLTGSRVEAAFARGCGGLNDRWRLPRGVVWIIRAFPAHLVGPRTRAPLNTLLNTRDSSSRHRSARCSAIALLGDRMRKMRPRRLGPVVRARWMPGSVVNFDEVVIFSVYLSAESLEMS